LEETNLAVLIDFENIAAGTEKEGLGRFDVNALMARVKDKGRILVARSYADWGRFSRFKQALLAANVTMMELTSHGMQDKNRADIAMVVDALELAFTRDYVDTFVVVSGDSDFTPMVLKMRELNKRIIGIGTRKSTSRLLIQACDEFIFYDAIVKKAKPSRRRKTRSNKAPSNLGKALDLLEDVLMGLQRENPDPVHASVVKTTMLRKSPDFNENDLGYSSFARFLEAAREAGLITLERDRKSGGYRVHPHDDSDEEDEEAEDDSNGVTPWSDDYLPKGSERLLAVLEQAKLPLLSAAVRKDVLGAFEDTVAERKKKRRKVTIGLVRDDMLKNRLRLTHPDLPSPRLKSLFDGLLQAGELIHRDGTAIRSASASFHLEKDATGLNESLVQLYLAHLVDVGADVSDTQMLSELFYGDKDQKRQIEETLAYLATAAQGDGGGEDLDLDDLLVMDAPAKEAPKKAEAKKEEPEKEEPETTDAKKEASEDAEPEAKPKRRRTRRKKSDDDDKADDDKVEDKADDAEADEKPAKKTTRKRTTRKKKEPEADADAAAEEKPKRRRSRKKKEPEAKESDGGDDLDALLEIG